MSRDDNGQVIQRLERARSDESLLGSWPDSVSAPLLVDTSDAEWVTSVQAVIALRTRGKPVEMVVYPDARHFKKWPRQLESVSGDESGLVRFLAARRARSRARKKRSSMRGGRN